jgi:maleate isomerase
MTIAVLTPMANPTVEAEFRALLPRDFSWVTGRLVSAEPDPLQRLIAYAEGISGSLRQFDTMKLAAVAFACTGSSYLIGRAREEELASQLPVPVLWAAAIIRERLAALGARRIAVISPYPSNLHDAGLTYWREAGFEVIHDARVEIGSSDTRAIYALGAAAAVEALARAVEARPDAVLLSGTGMPSLSLVSAESTPPILSSNLCLGEAMVAAAGDGA